jgi:hypothetical protein
MDPPRPHKTSFSVGTSTRPPAGTSAVIFILLGDTNDDDDDGLSERVGDNVKSILYELLLLLLLRLPKYALIT